MNKKADMLGLEVQRPEEGFEDTRGDKYGREMSQRQAPETMTVRIVDDPDAYGRGQPMFSDETGSAVRPPRTMNFTQQDLNDIYSQGGVVKDGMVFAKVDDGEITDDNIAFVGHQKNLQKQQQRFRYLDRIVQGIPSGSAPEASGKRYTVDPDLSLERMR